jgi:RimJ/RimL family protein N-acetyltransferase
VPRGVARLEQPEPPLADDVIRLEPITEAHRVELLELVADDAVLEFTLVPTGADAEFVSGWIGRYEHGWHDGSCAGFVARDVHDDTFLAFAAIVRLDLEARQGEIGYAVAPAARGRGVARRSVALLTRWGFDELRLIRLELDIDVNNPASERVAERAGYRLEGVRRSAYFKEGRRTDLGLWSRLRDDPPVP